MEFITRRPWDGEGATKGLRVINYVVPKQRENVAVISSAILTNQNAR